MTITWCSIALNNIDYLLWNRDYLFGLGVCFSHRENAQLLQMAVSYYYFPAKIPLVCPLRCYYFAYG